MLAGRPARVNGNLGAVPPLSTTSPWIIQRHSSWEHRLLGDAASDDLYSISHQGSNRTALLDALRDFLQMWSVNPDGVKPDDITKAYKDIRTVTLKTSGLLVTYGELNTLPDYVANAGQMDDLSRDILRPILQAVRQEGYSNVMRLLGQPNLYPKFEGAVAANLGNGTMNDVWESYWLDVLTADLPPDLPAGSLSWGTNSYGSILARNACHFAPYSWYRWQLSYDAALAKAQQAYQTKDPQTIHEAWIQHGLCRPLPPGFVRGGPSHQQDPGHAVVRGMGGTEMVRERPGLGRGPDHDGRATARARGARPVFAHSRSRS